LKTRPNIFDFGRNRNGLRVLSWLLGGAVFFLVVEDNLKFCYWHETLQYPEMVVGILAVLETGDDVGLSVGKNPHDCPMALSPLVRFTIGRDSLCKWALKPALACAKVRRWLSL